MAAALFGASTPFGKVLLGKMDPQWLAGLLYLGSGLGLGTWILLQRWFGVGKSTEASLTKADLPLLGGAIVAGGVIAPVLLMLGLRATPASTASLFLNLEGVFTAALAWVVFRENFDRRIFVGMVAILAGSVLLTWNGRPTGGIPWASIAIAGACLCWAIDNNLTRKVSAADPVQIAGLKGLIAGVVNVGIALAVSPSRPSATAAAGACVLGLFSYGISLVAFVLALRQLGTARTGAYFSTAPFIGAALSLAITWEHLAPSFWIAAALMAFGVWLHLTERHEHLHHHEAAEHTHMHTHDEHHQHAHDLNAPPGEPHSHLHRHEPLDHSHPHYPDTDHQHKH